MKQIKLLTLLLLCTNISWSQSENIFKFCPEVYQSSWYTATNHTPYRINIGLPVLSNLGFGVYNSGFALKEFVTFQDTVAKINFSALANSLNTKNYVGVYTNFSLLGAQVNTKKLTLGFAVNDRVNFKFSYPGDLAKLLAYGNGKYLGETLNLGGFGIDFSYHREYLFNVQKNITPKLRIGVSPKLLFGKLNISTKKSNITLTTASDYYSITGTSEIEIQTSGMDSSSIDEFSQNPIKTAFNANNMGLGLNLGGQYEISKKINITAGINDIGYINWKDKNTKYSTPLTSVTYEGVDINNLLNGDSFSYEQILDTLADKFKINTTKGEAYRTNLPLQFYAMGSYKLNSKLTVSANIVSTNIIKQSINAATIGIHYKPSKHFSSALSIETRTNSPIIIGAMTMVQGAGMQYYVATDNILGAFNLMGAKSSGITTGLNICFGKIANKDAKKEARRSKQAKEKETKETVENLLDTGSNTDPKENKSIKKKRQKASKTKTESPNGEN